MRHHLRRIETLPFGLFGAVGLALFTGPAAATDLTVAAIEVNQGVQYGSTTLVARNATVVRVRVGVSGAKAAVPGVDAELRVFADGVEIPGSPFFSANGPITAPLSPSSANLNHTLNFLCVPPQSADVDFVVTVNPTRRVTETDYANNVGTSLNRVFACRRMVEMLYVPVDYLPGGGLPSAATIEPGLGDAFLRGIFRTGDWNYHRSPLGTLTWKQSINASNNALLIALNDIRLVQVPGQGYEQAAFIYGWLPGNPFSGNGQAIGIPGGAAFGNTETSRFQRTFAHEIGHCWGQPHNNSLINTVGFDVENQLRYPLNLPQVMPTSKRDVMVAGLLTADAWVNSVTYNDCLTDSRSQCVGGDGGSGGGGGADDARAAGRERCLRLAGELVHDAGRLELVPSMRLDLVEPTPDDPRGDAEVVAYDAGGRPLHAVRVRTGTCRESCCGTRLLDRTPFHVLVPETVRGRAIHAIRVRDLATGAPLAEQVRSARAPSVAIVGIGAAGAGPAPADPALPLEGEVEVRWVAVDPDGDAVSVHLLYSPDGGEAWFPIEVNREADATGGEVATRFATGNLPASVGAAGLVKLRASDGLNQSEFEWPMGLLMGSGSPPDVHVIAPKQANAFPRHASVVLHGSGWDMEDRLLPEASLAWTSDRQGPIGTGRLLVTRDLVAGTHVLTLTGTDSSGLSSQRSVTVTIVPREVRFADLDGDGAVGAADLTRLLGAWGAADFGPEDLDLDGIVGPTDLAILLGSW